MATALANIRPLAWIGSRSGAPFHSVTLPEGTSETFAAGHLVIMDISENGVVGLTTSSGVPSAQAFYGIALDAATGTAASPIDVLVPTPDDLFVASLASAQDTYVAPDVDNQGSKGGIILMDSSNSSVYAVDENNTNWVVIEQVYGPDVTLRGGYPYSLPTMSTGDRVVFRFLNSILDTAGNQA